MWCFVCLGGFCGICLVWVAVFLFFVGLFVCFEWEDDIYYDVIGCVAKMCQQVLGDHSLLPFS